MTQIQMMWHRKINLLLMHVTACQNSLTYWRGEYERMDKSRSQKISHDDRRMAHENIAFRESDLRAAEEALVEWVKSHPYPA